MKYSVCHKDYSSIDEAADAVLEAMDIQVYKDYLDENEPIVEVCGLTFYPSRVLSELAESDLDELFYDWKDSLRDDLEHEIGEMDANCWSDFYGVKVFTEEEPDDYDIPDEPRYHNDDF